MTVPVSAGLLTDTDAYFAALTRYREGDPTVIVEAFANAALVASETGIAQQNTYRALRALLDAGVLVEFTDRKRN